MASTTSNEGNLHSAQSLFDDIGHRYQEAFGYNVSAHIRSLNRLLKDLPPNAKAVDIGCGTGKPALEMLSKAGHKVMGVDISPQMIETARAQVPGGEFEVHDSKTWKPKESDIGTFDAVTAYFSFLIDMSQKDIRDFFPRAFSWVKPGGIFVFGTVPIDIEHGPVKWLGREFKSSSLSTEDVLKGIKEAGFEVEFHEVEEFRPKGEEAGLCGDGEVNPEPHVFVHACKPGK